MKRIPGNQAISCLKLIENEPYEYMNIIFPFLLTNWLRDFFPASHVSSKENTPEPVTLASRSNPNDYT